jgi:hypothetical protein
MKVLDHHRTAAAAAVDDDRSTAVATLPRGRRRVEVLLAGVHQVDQIGIGSASGGQDTGDFLPWVLLAGS